MNPTDVPRATRREWLGLVVLTLPTLLLSIDMSVLYLALPKLTEQLRPSGTEQLWILDIYGFMVAGFLVTMGTLGDRIGRRRLLLIGGAAFALASAVAAFSVNAEMLIITRAAMGIAGATLMPSTLALISNMFRDAKQRSFAISVWISCFMGGMALGPVVGGILLQHFWWGSVFCMNVPVLAVLLITCPLLLPEFRDENAGRIDLVSVALSLAAILPVVYGLKELAKHGWQTGAVVAIGAGVAFGAAFWRRQRRLPDPLIDVRLFRSRVFCVALAIMLFGGAAQGGVQQFVTQFLQIVEGLSPLQAAFWSIPGAVALITGSLLTPRIARRVAPGTLLAIALLIAGAGFAIMAAAGSFGLGSGVLVLAVGMAVNGFGAGPQGTAATDLVLGAAPPERAGAASSLSETSAEFGIAFGVAAFGSIGTVVYQLRLDPLTGPGLSPQAADAARESVGGAYAVAADLPQGPAEALIAAARDAFTSGLTVAASVAVAITVVLAGLTLLVLRRRTAPPTSGPESEPDPESDPEPDAALACAG